MLTIVNVIYYPDEPIILHRPGKCMNSRLDILQNSTLFSIVISQVQAIEELFRESITKFGD